MAATLVYFRIKSIAFSAFQLELVVDFVGKAKPAPMEETFHCKEFETQNYILQTILIHYTREIFIYLGIDHLVVRTRSASERMRTRQMSVRHYTGLLAALRPFRGNHTIFTLIILFIVYFLR